MKNMKKLAALIAVLSLTACSAPADSLGSEAVSESLQTAEATKEVSVPSQPETQEHTSEQESGSEPPQTVQEPQDTQEYNDDGYCAVLTSVSAVTAGGHTLEYTIDEQSGCAYTSVTYSTDYVPDSDLKSSTLSAQAENGVCRFGSSEGSAAADLTEAQTLTVEDVNGAKKTYTIITQRTEGLLPIVNITLDGGKSVTDISRTDHTGMSISIDISKSPEYPSGLAEVKGKIRGRGNSTWKWEKKPYKIKLEEKAEVLGLAANKDWILLSNYADKSLMRDTVAYDMSRTLDNLGWVPTQYPVDLFINGEYQGVYSIGEHMEAAKSRVDITENPDGGECGYLLEVGGSDDNVDVEGVDYFHVDSDMLRYITFREPEPNELTDSQRQAIIDCFNAADNAIVNGGDLAEYIDIDSFCDWVIIQELTNNTDSAFRRSCYFTKEVGEKLKMGPVWDFDLAFGNLVVDNQYYNTWTIIGSDDDEAYVTRSWGNYLMQNEQFRSRLRERWGEVRDRLLSAAMTSIDHYAEKIYPSQQENFNVWKIWDQKPGYSSWANYNANTYELQVQYLKDFLTKRAAWIDDNI